MPRCLFNRNEPIFNSFVYFIVRHSQIYTQINTHSHTHTHRFQNCFLIVARERELKVLLFFLYLMFYFSVWIFIYLYFVLWMNKKFAFIFHRFFDTHFLFSVFFWFVFLGNVVQYLAQNLDWKFGCCWLLRYRKYSIFSVTLNTIIKEKLIHHFQTHTLV